MPAELMMCSPHWAVVSPAIKVDYYTATRAWRRDHLPADATKVQDATLAAVAVVRAVIGHRDAGVARS